MRTAVTLDDDLAAEARELGINVSEAARQGLRQAIRRPSRRNATACTPSRNEA
jgi:post-segregation antitoxin (ccd killing protein)